jgi:hypothetical protein
MKTFISICALFLLSIRVSSQSADSSRYFFLKASEEKSGRLYMQAYYDYKRALEFDAKNPDFLRGQTLCDKAITVDPSLKSLKTEARIDQ